AARMLEAEEDAPRHHEIEIGRAIGAGKARFGMGIVADDVEVDVAAAIDLRAREEEDVDAPLAGAVEEIAPAVGPEIVLGALLQRDAGRVGIELLRQEG